MELDFTARRTLTHLHAAIQEERGSLLWVLDRTGTAMEAGLLRGWLEKPLLNPAAIGRRLNAVEELVRDSCARGADARHQGPSGNGAPDLRIVTGRQLPGPESLGQACEGIPAIRARLSGLIPA
jgi:DNA mismatch repair protein MutS